MITYHIRYYLHDWKNTTIVASNINNLRIRLLKDYKMPCKMGIIVKVKKGKIDGNPIEEIGRLSIIDGTPYWRNNKGMYRVSVKSGRLLDYDKYWRYI